MTTGDLLAFSSIVRDIQAKALRANVDLLPENRRQIAIINSSVAEIPDVNAVLNRTYLGKIFVIERSINRADNDFPKKWGENPGRQIATALDLDDTRELYREIAGRGGFLSPSTLEESIRWKKPMDPPQGKNLAQTMDGGIETSISPDTQAAP